MVSRGNNRDNLGFLGSKYERLQQPNRYHE